MDDNKTLDVDVRDSIMEYLKKIERNLHWLANKTGFVYSTLYSIFVQKVIILSDERKKKINEVLNTTF